MHCYSPVPGDTFGRDRVLRVHMSYDDKESRDDVIQCTEFCTSVHPLLTVHRFRRCAYQRMLTLAMVRALYILHVPYLTRHAPSKQVMLVW